MAATIRQVREQLPSVRMHAWRARRRFPREELGELVGEGHLALMLAAGRFDPGRGVKFGTFADRYIRGTMLEHHRRLGRFANSMASLEAVAGRGERIADGGPSPRESAEATELWSRVARLPGREAVAIAAFYREGRSLDEIGRMLGTTTGNASEIKRRGLRRMARNWDRS